VQIVGLQLGRSCEYVMEGHFGACQILGLIPSTVGPLLVSFLTLLIGGRILIDQAKEAAIVAASLISGSALFVAVTRAVRIIRHYS
jgi:hypothetical protein